MEGRDMSVYEGPGSGGSCAYYLSISEVLATLRIRVFVGSELCSV